METLRGEFALGTEPQVGAVAAQERFVPATANDFGELPRSYDLPLLIAVARDPRTLFAYWDVDWQSAFADESPGERAVYLRVLCENDKIESETAIEPLAGSSYVKVENADCTYRVALGYRDRSNEWKSIIVSPPVITPRDSVAQGADFQLVTVPLHLHFQRMVEIFRGSKYDGQAISDAISGLQQSFENREPAAQQTPQDAQLARAIEWRLSPAEAQERADFRHAAAAEKPIGRARLERILGFGATSPAPSSADSGGGS